MKPLEFLALLASVTLLIFTVTLAEEKRTVENLTVSCGDLGEFPSYGGTFKYRRIRYRPSNLHVNCSIIPYISFHLNTRRDKVPDRSTVLNHKSPDTIRYSTFDPTRETVLLMHGYLDRYDREESVWPGIMRRILAEFDHNVIRINWDAGSSLCTYTQACANLRLVSAYMAQFIASLVNSHGANPEQIHIIGHSLGAHGAGHAGTVLQSKYGLKIGRITGLDPAGPFFTGMPASMRLDPTDADFVTTFVTNANIFGSNQSMGHLNLFAHGGLTQFKCSDGDVKPFSKVAAWLGLAEQAPETQKPQRARPSSVTSLDIFGCSHNMAVFLYSQTIMPASSNCKFSPTPCASRSSEDEGPCSECTPGNPCYAVGYFDHASVVDNHTVVNLYIDTTKIFDTCREIKFTVDVHPKLGKYPSYDFGGNLTLSVSASMLNDTERVSLTSDFPDIHLTVGTVTKFHRFALLEKKMLSALDFEISASDGLCASIAHFNLLKESLRTDRNSSGSCLTKRKINMAVNVRITQDFVEQDFSIESTGLLV